MSHHTNDPLSSSFIDLAPIAHMAGEIVLPGSKSISNRALLLAALAQGETTLLSVLDSDDTAVMLEALRQLGVVCLQEEGHCYVVKGSNGRFPIASASLFMGNAGTAIRPLVATLAVLGGEYRIEGVARMHERPIGDLVDTLNKSGADICYLGQKGFPPLHIHAGHIDKGYWQIKGAVSSQFLTALLMAAPLACPGQSKCIEVVGPLISQPYIAITLDLMRRFGVHVEHEAWRRFTIPHDQSYHSPGTFYVEGDASSASYFLAAGVIAGGPVRVVGVGKKSIQGDIDFAHALAQMGATVTWGDNFIEVKGGTPLHGIDIDCNTIPDAAMTLAMVALYATGNTTLRNIGSWRIKETDRMSAMYAELMKLGARVTIEAEDMVIAPPHTLTPATIATYDDHRMAMCFSLASLHGATKAGVPIRILDPLCVTKTFPNYFDLFLGLKRP